MLICHLLTLLHACGELTVQRRVYQLPASDQQPLDSDVTQLQATGKSVSGYRIYTYMMYSQKNFLFMEQSQWFTQC